MAYTCFGFSSDTQTTSLLTPGVMLHHTQDQIFLTQSTIGKLQLNYEILCDPSHPGMVLCLILDVP